MRSITYEDIRHNQETLIYIDQGDQALGIIGYTEHALPHATITAQTAGRILSELGYSEREAELARITGFMHDIGNMVNRSDHAQSGAIIAFRILDHLDMPPEEVALVVSAIGNHDEGTAVPIHPIAAALILADKSDVRRSRVRNQVPSTFDIHDRVNYAVQRSEIEIDATQRICTLDIQIDSEVTPVFDFFEIFLGRMLLCRKACAFLELSFHLRVNGFKML